MHNDPYKEMNVISVGRKALMVLCLLFLQFLAISQNITETQWYFGNSSQNLVFDLNGRGAQIENKQATAFGTGGSSVIVDQFTGRLLFYSDGEQIFDGSHNQLTNALTGNSSINVPVVAAPVSNTPGQYYFFTNSGSAAPNEIQYTTVDGATQAIVSPNNPTGLTNPSEGMIVIPAGDGITFWLISQNRTTFEYLVTRLDNGGISAPTTYDFTASSPGTEAAHFSFDQTSLSLAVAPKTANRNVRILDFDPATGVLAFREVLLNTGYNDGQGESVYDLEWSNDGTKLYISRFGSAGMVGDVYQYDFSDAAPSTRSILFSPIFRSYGLQTGLDGKIYHLYQLNNGSPFTLGRINEPDSLFDRVAYDSLIFPDNFNGRQFPNFTAGYEFTFNTLDFTYIDSCQNDNTKFFPIVDPVPHQFSWDFGDGGGGSNSVSPIYAYQASGGYTVNLTATINGISQTVTKPITVFANTAMVDLGNDTTICIDEILVLDAGAANGYVWSTGEITQTIAVDTAGTYWVEVVGPEGCTAYDEIIVTEYGSTRTVNNQWYFGERAGIDFTDGATPITDGNSMYSPEGCSSISDINGNLLFYTNGSTVWNLQHSIMANGQNIGGDSTAVQSAIIMPFADESTMFYIFTTQEVPGLLGRYQTKVSVVDMKKDNALGRVMVKDLPLNNFSTEKLAATSVTNPGWLLAHEFGTNMFRSNFVDATGIGENVFSAVGEVHDIADDVQGGGAMKFANGAQFVGNALPRTGGNFLELFDFDQTTGAVSNSRLINIQETDPLYGLEFSTDNSKIYLTTLSGSSKLIQYDLDSINAPTAVADITNSKFDGYPTGASYGSLQTGPDGVIYMAVDGSTTIGTINAPNGDNAGAGFVPNGFDLLTRRSRLGLPNFAQEQSSALIQPGITTQIGCYGQTTRFSAAGRDSSIEQYFWFFGDGTVIEAQDTVHSYAAPGTYTVRLLLTNRCDQDTSIYQTITIDPLPDVPQIPLDSYICDQPLVLSAWPVDRPGWSYVWSTGDTTRTVTINGSSIVSVYMVDPGGCRSETVFSFVADGRPTVDITATNGGSDVLIVCQDDPSLALDGGNPGASYLWTINGTPSGNSRTLNTDTSTPGVFQYIVEVTDPVTTCIGRDTLNLTVLPLPDVTIVPTPTSGCANVDGAIDMTFNVAGNYTYVLTGPTSAGPFIIDGPIAMPNLVGLNGGNYTMTVTDNVTGCVRISPVVVEDPPTFNAVASAPNACPDEGIITITFGGVAPATINYIVTDENGVQVRNDVGLSTVPLTNLDVTNLPLGTYTVFIEEIGGSACIEQEVVTIGQLNAEPSFTFDAIQNICGVSGQAFVVDGSTGLATFTWSGPGIVGLNTGVSVTVNQPGTYTVIASQPTLCDREEQIVVNLSTPHTAAVGVTGDPCEGQLTLAANITGGVGPFSYQWNSGQQGAQYTALQSGNYFVTVRDQATGCEVTSSSVDIVVEELLEVAISAAPICNDINAISLMAIPTFTTGVTYTWVGPNGPLSSTAQTIRVTQEGLYTVTATNPAGTCSISADFTAIITPITDADLLLPETANFCSLDAANPGVALNPGTFNTYSWTRVPDPTVISTSPVFYATQSGTYEVTLYNGFTCRTDRVIVRDDCQPVIFAPTAFTPNGDGLNDEFAVIPNPNVVEFAIIISNRWGEAIYKSTDQSFKWDGIYQGKLLPPGTYTYIMTFRSTIDSSAGNQKQYGAVVLIR